MLPRVRAKEQRYQSERRPRLAGPTGKSIAIRLPGSYRKIFMKIPRLLPAATLSAAILLVPSLRADEESELKEQPAAVQKTAREQIGASKIEEVESTFEEGQHATEVEYSEGGHKMAVVIAKDGTLIQKEHRLSPGEAPAAIVKAVEARYPGGKISHIKQIDQGAKTFFRSLRKGRR